MDTILQTNHIALLQHWAKTSGDTILFKLPILRGFPEPPVHWKDVTMAEFSAKIDKVASFLITELLARGVPPRSVVGLLFSGYQHRDLVYAIALSRACYIPQVLPGHTLNHPGVLFSLAEKAGSKIILYDPSYEALTIDCPYPKMVMMPIETIENLQIIGADVALLPQVHDLPSGSDLFFFSVTSGSTSGSPKIVPLNQESINVQVRTGFGTRLDKGRFAVQDVFPAPGSICHITQLIQYLGCLYTKSCMVVPSKGQFSTEELSNMINACGLNHMVTFGAQIAPYIEAARNDVAVLKLLQKMRTVSYAGAAIPVLDDDWCFQNGVPLVDLYGTTECGYLMASVGGRPSRFMQPAPGVSCRFDSVDVISGTRIDDSTSSSQLLTLVILPESPQIPDSHLLSADGSFHTCDLFTKQPDGSYLFRGRNDDLIKTADADLIDTATMEDKIRELCEDLIKQFVVVGHLRPSPALFIEVPNLLMISQDSLKELLLRRLDAFNAGRYVYGQIADKRLILIMEEGTLPRSSKGVFKRKAIEEMYRTELDAAYMSVYS